MELCNKILIKSKEQAQNLIDEWNESKYWAFIDIEDFKQYPALVSYLIDFNDYGMSHTAVVYYSITYLTDFDED